MNSNCLGPKELRRGVTPVTLPRGWLRLLTRPNPTESAPVKKTMGMVLVAAFAASAAGTSRATISATHIPPAIVVRRWLT